MEIKGKVFIVTGGASGLQADRVGNGQAHCSERIGGARVQGHLLPRFANHCVRRGDKTGMTLLPWRR